MPPPKQSRSLRQEDFDLLLEWLALDREQAGIEYEKIRRRLITIFASRGCRIPEELTDETINRVCLRVADIQETYSGNKVLYFLGVANNVHHEYLKRRVLAAPENLVSSEEKEQIFDCLEHCIARLTERSQELIRQYYAEDKQKKIALRRKLADQLGINLNALRVRALRIREELQLCIERCLATK